MNLKIKNHSVSPKLRRNIYKVSVIEKLSHKQVKRLMDKITNNIPITYK